MFGLARRVRQSHLASACSSPSSRLNLVLAYGISPEFRCGVHSLSIHFFLFFFFHLTYSRWTSSLPSCLWSQRIFPSLPGSRLTIFLSRCKFSTLTTRQPMVEFYLLTFPRFPLRKKEHKSYFGKNRTHDFRTSRCAAYLLHYVCVCFLPIHSGHQVRWTYQPGSHRRKVTQDF